MADSNNQISNAGGRITIIHVMIVSLSMMLTFTVWQFSKYQMETRMQTRFETSRDRALGLIVDRMAKYEDALWAGVATIESHGGDISHQDWQTFAHTLRIDEKYPGISGIGVIHFHTAQSLDVYLSVQRRERPDFRIFPDHEEAVYMPITFIEPEDINAAAIGLDVAHELNRRTAALASRDTGTAQITGPITLVQDTDRTPGFLFYAPFYRGDAPLSTADRQDRILGVVYAPFVVHQLMEGLLATELRDVRFSISDGHSLIYDEHITTDPMIDHEPLFSEEVSIEIYGRTWTLDVRSDLAFRQQNTNSQPTLILIAGLLIECLIISLLVLMSRANKHAVAYAGRVTQALKRKTAELSETNTELSRKNEELEQFAYVASHDLKTPVRGIGGLTEMIEQDLEDYFSSSTANPNVQKNLELINDRVKRMTHLTCGIMELSQIDTNYRENHTIDMKEAVETLILDFGLDVDQLKLSGDLGSVYVDTFNFRRVLENLVSNAIKYHDGKQRLQITIFAKSGGDLCHVSITDNGPGIDPKFHEKIFEIFQKLHTAGAPESTGIGLAIVKKAVERNGGKVGVISSKGQGATFSFSWPIHEYSDVSEILEGAA